MIIEVKILQSGNEDYLPLGFSIFCCFKRLNYRQKVIYLISVPVEAARLIICLCRQLYL